MTCNGRRILHASTRSGSRACITWRTRLPPPPCPLPPARTPLSVAAVLREFPGLEHRLEFVREKDGVDLYQRFQGHERRRRREIPGRLHAAGDPDRRRATTRGAISARLPRSRSRKQVKLLVLIGKAADKMGKALAGSTETVFANIVDRGRPRSRRPGLLAGTWYSCRRPAPVSTCSRISRTGAGSSRKRCGHSSFRTAVLNHKGGNHGQIITRRKGTLRRAPAPRHPGAARGQHRDGVQLEQRRRADDLRRRGLFHEAPAALGRGGPGPHGGHHAAGPPPVPGPARRDRAPPVLAGPDGGHARARHRPGDQRVPALAAARHVLVPAVGAHEVRARRLPELLYCKKRGAHPGLRERIVSGLCRDGPPACCCDQAARFRRRDDARPGRRRSCCSPAAPMCSTWGERRWPRSLSSISRWPTRLTG